MSEVPVGPPMHTEGSAPGTRLNSYVTKEASEDGTYVVITDHKERIELIPQPLTPEEIDAQKKSERLALAVVGGLGVAFFALMGWVTYMGEKDAQRTREFATDTELDPTTT